MYSYELLETGCYYLIQEREKESLKLIQVMLETDHCMYITSYGEEEKLLWKRKTDRIHDIVELLSDTVVKQWESLYNNNEDAFYEDED